MNNQVIEAGSASSVLPGVSDVPAVMKQPTSNPSQNMTSTEPNQDAHESSLIDIPDYMIEELNAADELEAMEPAAGSAKLPAPVEKKTASVAADSFEVTVGGVTYVASSNSLYRKTTAGDKTTLDFVSSIIVVVANARDNSSSSWGKVIRFEDQDGIRKEIYVPNRDITTDGRAVIKRLVNEGLVVSTHRGMVDALLHFLNLASPIVAARAECSDRIGWHGNVYLFHDNSVIGHSERRFVYTGAPIGNYGSKGTSQDWKNNVATLCRGNSLLILAVSVSFASVLLRLLKAESCGYHFFGESSTGKSTSLYVAASVHGDPESLIGSWNTTVAGMEGRAKKFTDSLMINDELHESNAKDTGKVVYMIMNGKGRQRSTQQGDARDVAEWRLNCLSSGEESSEEYIRKNGGNPRAGQAVRMLDISADMGLGLGVFENIHDAKNSHAFAEQIKKASLENFGAPVREFLQNLIGRIDRLDSQFDGIKAKFFTEFVPEESGSQVKRVASKMVVSAMAGEMATAMGLTGWKANEAFESVGGTFTKWLASRGTTGQQEAETGIEQVKDFLLRHGMSSRFIPIIDRPAGGYRLEFSDRQVISSNTAGFRVTSNDAYEFIVFPEAYRKEMCEGLIANNVTKTLVERGYLRVDEKTGKPQVRHRLPGIDLGRYYHFTSAILSDADEFVPAVPETEE